MVDLNNIGNRTYLADPIDNNPQQVGPNDDFEEVKKTHEKGLAYFPPEAGIFMGQTYANIVSGTNWSFGINSLFNTEDPKKLGGLLSLRYSGIVAGFDFTDMIPCFGIGGIYYKHGTGLSIGAYTLGGKSIFSNGIVPFAAISTIGYLLGSVGTEKEGWQIIAGAVGNILNFFIPVNPIREFINFLDYAASKPSAMKEVNTFSKLTQLIGSFGSYNNKGLIFTALTKLDDLILSSSDPYVRASLRSMKDEFLLRCKMTVLPVTISGRQKSTIEAPTTTIEQNITDSIVRVEDFGDRYGPWLKGPKDGKAPLGKKPSTAETRRYMEDVLYLSNKLPMILKSAKSGTKKTHTIIVNSAFYLERPEHFARFIKELCSAYQFFSSKGSGLYQFIRSGIKGGAENVSKTMKGHAALQLMLMWCKQMTENGKYFDIRKNYIRWKIKETPPSRIKRDALDIVNGLEISTQDNRNALKSLTDTAETAAYLPFSGYFTGLEELEALAKTEHKRFYGLDDMVERGFDLASFERPERSFENAFDRLYDLKKYRLAIEERRLESAPRASWKKLEEMASRLEALYAGSLVEAVKKGRGELIRNARASLKRKNSADMRAFEPGGNYTHLLNSLRRTSAASEKIKDIFDEHGLKESSNDAIELRRTIENLTEEMKAFRHSVVGMKSLRQIPYSNFNYSTYIKAIVAQEREEKEIIDVHSEKIGRLGSSITETIKKITAWSESGPESQTKKDVIEKIATLNKNYMDFQRFSTIVEAALKRVQSRRARVSTMIHFANLNY